MSTLHHEAILETIYDEIVVESINNLAKFGIFVNESELDSESIEQETYRRFEDLCQQPARADDGSWSADLPEHQEGNADDLRRPRRA